MMRWIIGSSLKARGFVLLLAAAMLVLGIAQLRNMPKDVLPEFNPRRSRSRRKPWGSLRSKSRS